MTATDREEAPLVIVSQQAWLGTIGGENPAQSGGDRAGRGIRPIAASSAVRSKSCRISASLIASERRASSRTSARSTSVRARLVTGMPSMSARSASWSSTRDTLTVMPSLGLIPRAAVTSILGDDDFSTPRAARRSGGSGARSARTRTPRRARASAGSTRGDPRHRPRATADGGIRLRSVAGCRPW